MDVSSVPTSPINQRNLHPKNSPEKTEDSRQDGAGRDGEHVSEKKNEDIDQKTSNTELDKDQVKTMVFQCSHEVFKINIKC